MLVVVDCKLDTIMSNNGDHERERAQGGWLEVAELTIEATKLLDPQQPQIMDVSGAS